MAVKHSTETGTTSTRNEVFAAACVTLGIALKDDSPGVDNVYSKDRPFRDSVEGKHAGVVNYYLHLSSPDGLLTGGLLKFWEDPGPVEKEMHEFPLRLGTADTTELKRIAAEDLKNLIPCAALVWMRKAAKETPRAFWHRYGEPSAAEARAWQLLEEAPDQIRVGRFELKSFAGLFVPAMHAAVKTFFLNACELETMRQDTAPSLKIERPNLPSIPFVIQMTPGWRDRMQKLNPLGKKKTR